jgi:hypothetical protein
MKEVIIIGNKPYKNLSLDCLLDSFDSNHRCNMSLANKNNGTIHDNLGLCIHLYENLITKKLEPEDFRKEYSNDYKDENVVEFLKFFEKKNYNRIYLADNFAENTAKFNRMLNDFGCPYTFTRMPRTGYTIIMENLYLGLDVFVSNFSIKDEERVSYYVRDEKYENPMFHCKDEELKIIRWLHENRKIDASFCLLEDTETPTFDCSIFEPSEISIAKVLECFGNCKLLNSKLEVNIEGYKYIEENDSVLIFKKQ